MSKAVACLFLNYIEAWQEVEEGIIIPLCRINKSVFAEGTIYVVV